MKYIIQFLDAHLISIGAILIFLPLAILAFFNHPVGPHDWDWAGNFGQTGYSVFDHIKEQYLLYTGRYFTIFQLALIPYWFSLTTFKLFPFFLVLILLASTWYLFKALPIQQDSTSRSKFVLLFSMLYICGLSGIFEMLYTLSSGFQYWSACVLFMCWLGAFLRYQNRPTKGLLFVLLFLIICLNGSTEINLILLNIVLGLYGLHTLVYQRKIPAFLLLLGVVSLGSALVEILAPGNYSRMSDYAGSKNIVFALAFAIPAMLQNFLAWIVNTPLILLSLVLIVPIQKALKGSKHPLLEAKNIKWFFVGLLATQFLPLVLLLYASGPNSLPERVMDVLYLHFLLAWFLILAACVKNYFPVTNFRIPITIQRVLSMTVLLFILFNPLKINRDLKAPKQLNMATIANYIDIDNNIGKAYLTLLDGSAASYSAANYSMYEKLKTCSSDSCYVEVFECYPSIIYESNFDRKLRRNGDKYMLYYLQGRFGRVFYEK